MTLTVPRAGTNPGRAANAGEVVVNEAGAGVANLGDALANIGTALVNDRLDRQFKRNQVDLTRDLNSLRLEVQGMGDPDAAEASWAQGVEQLRASYIQPGETGDARVAARNAERFNLAFDDMANTHAYRLGARNLELRQAEHEATYLSYVNEAAQVAATSDATTRAELIRQGEVQIASLQDAGIIDAAEAERRRQDLGGALNSVAANEALAADPALFLQQLDDGEYPELDPQSRLKLKTTALDALQKATELEAKQAEKAAADRRSNVSADLSRIASLGDTTRLSASDRELLENPEIREIAQSDEDVAIDLRKAQARVSLDEEKRLFSAMSPRELREAIEEERGRKVAHKFQEERLTVLEDLLAEREAAIEADAIGHVSSIGYEPPALPLDQGAEAFEAGLSARKKHSAWMQREGFIDAPVIFQPDEAKAIKAQLDTSADPEQRRALVQGMARQLGPDAQDVIEDATGDRVVAHAATLSGMGAPEAVVTQIMTGQKRLADGTATRPTAANLRQSFADLTGGQFADQPELQARLMGATEAIYADLNPNGDSADIDSDMMRMAVNRALGGDGSGRGGIGSVDPSGLRNAYDLILPPGVSGQTVSEAFDAATEELRPTVFKDPVSGQIVDRAEDFSRFEGAAINATGAAVSARPVLGDSESDAFSTMRIEPWWPDGKPADRYILTRRTNTGWVAVQSDQGGPFYFSLRKFTRGAR